jgi:hypothetical protein
MSLGKQKKAKSGTIRKDTSDTIKSPVVHNTRKVDPFVRLYLFVRSGGRCQFDGCNKYLLEHHVTLTEGNFAQIAHVVAFREDGPRGKGPRPKSINNIENLMLLCPGCHKLIDDHPDRFTRQTLEGYKKRHDQRILHVTGLGPEQKTSILILKSKIGGQTVTIPFDQVLEAITPRYPYSKDGLTIDLTQLPATDDSFIKAACATISEELRGFFASGGEFKKSGHISFFGLAPIPVLAFLGSQLSNKVPLDLFQRHRDKENWTWKENQTAILYGFRELQKGSDPLRVTLILSLSGSIPVTLLPAEIDAKFSIYEMTLASAVPNPTFLNTKADLEEFRNSYQLALGKILKNHPGIRSIDLFPAVPAPVAVLCGRELLPKVHPELRIYDNDKRKGGFVYQLTLNQI